MTSSASLRPLPLAIGSLVAGKYRIDSVLGSGGMGTVFAALNVDLGRQVAIKVLHHDLAQDEELVRRLRQEARAAAAIGHPGIVDVLDLGTTEGGDPFIVMERLEGEPLGARLAARTRLSPIIAVGIVLEAVEALAAAHAKGILHRDLKPDNIFLILHPEPTVKLVDFGLAKQQSEDLSITRSGVVMGTPLYMSPEQARGARDVGPAGDLYSIGAILYQALSGTPPHTATNYNEMLAKVLMNEPAPLAIAVPELPPMLVELVHELLDKDPAARPTAIETAQRLRVIERSLDSPIAFSPTLEPDNVSDDELAAAADATLPPTTATPVRPLAVTVPSLSPSAQHAAQPFDATVAPMTPSAQIATPALDVTVAPVSPSAQIATALPAPSAQIASARPRSARLVVLAVAMLAVVVAIIVYASRRSARQDSAAVVVDAPAVADAAPVAVDASTPPIEDASAPADVAPPRDTPAPRDAAPLPRRDAGAPPRDAALPDATRTAVDAGDLDIDPTNPLRN